jgi:glycine/D-amino acid oxidase-like deaminating enzyme
MAGELAGGLPPAVVGSLLQPNRDGTLLAGASRQQVVTAEPEDPHVPLRIVRNAIRLAPALRHAEVLASWWGIRPCTPDGKPVVGFVDDGLLVATGHGSQGVILGAGTGRLAASLVTGSPPPFDPAPVRPDRFANPLGDSPVAFPGPTMDS